MTDAGTHVLGLRMWHINITHHATYQQLLDLQVFKEIAYTKHFTNIKNILLWL